MKRRGSTRAWRRLRAFVLERDGWRCKVPLDDGLLCGQPANTVGHLDRLCDGGPLLAPSHRLRAECAKHNYSDGAQVTNERRRGRAPRWSW